MLLANHETPFVLPLKSWVSHLTNTLPAMQFDNKDGSAKMLAKVRALLAKAESTEFAEEAEIFTAKAQALMSAYSIDEALLRQENVERGTVAPNRRLIKLEKPYLKQKAHLLSHIANANNSRVVWNVYLGEATLFGFDADLDLIEILYTSLLVQADAAMRAAGPQESAWGASSTRSFRSSFLYAFGIRIGQRLREAQANALEVAGSGAALVVRSQLERVERAVTEAYPQARSSNATTISNASGWAAGTRAADRADIGHRRRLKAG
jgi:hypothetical protein